MSFSPVQASIEGFRFIRDRPRPVTVWMLALLALNLAATVFNLTPWAGRLRDLQQASGIEWSWALLRDLAIHLLPAAAIALFLTFASLCIVAPSIFRVMLGKTQGPVFRLGEDEWRMFWLFLAVLLLVMLAAVPTGIIFGYSRVFAANFGLAQVVSAITSVVSFLLFCWIVMRSSFAALIEVDTHRLDISASWRLTKGAFWRLMLTALLCFIWTALVILAARGLSYVIGTVIAFVLGFSQQQFHEFLWPTSGSLWDLFGPGPMIWKVLLAAELTVAYCVACGALVYAYRDLRQRQQQVSEA